MISLNVTASGNGLQLEADPQHQRLDMGAAGSLAVAVINGEVVLRPGKTSKNNLLRQALPPAANADDMDEA